MSGGIREDLVAAADFIQVRAALVREIGAHPAMVWQLVQFRTLPTSLVAYELDGHSWWRANHTEIAQASGLTERQVRSTLTKLEEAGHLVADRHRLEGAYDQTKSYRAVVLGAKSVTSMCPDPSDPHVTNAVTSSYKKEEEGVGVKNTSSDNLVFERAWKRWPRNQEKKKALAKFTVLVKNGLDAEELAAHVVRFGDAYRDAVAPEFVPYLVTWLNGERWSEDLPQPRDQQKKSAFQKNLDRFNEQYGGPEALDE